MQFQLNTDANIQGDNRLAEVAQNLLASSLGHLTSRLSRIEVHLADVNAAKGGADDIRCTIEARPEGMQPQAVTHSDANVEAALRGGAKKCGRFWTANSANLPAANAQKWPKTFLQKMTAPGRGAFHTTVQC